MPTPDTNFSRNSVEELLVDYGAEKYTTKKGEIVFLVENVVIRFPKGNKRIPYDMLEEIAMEQLELSRWEFDYWLGEN